MKTQRKKRTEHFCLIVNKSASGYNPELIKKLIKSIRKKGFTYTVFEPDSAIKLLHTAEKAAGVRKWHRQVPKAFQQRGKVTALVACGGDGTVNLVGRAGLKANIPVGILPMGKFNNIFNSIIRDNSTEYAIKAILKGEYRKIDYGMVGQQIFFGSIGLRFTVEMQRQLARSNLSKFAFRWGQYAGKAIDMLEKKKMIIKIDSFRFEVSPTILNINLLPYSVGIPVSEVSSFDDSIAEIIFDFESDRKKITQFVRQVYKKKYLFGNDVQIFRGQRINIQPTKGEVLYLDGELIDLPNETVDIEINSDKLKLFY